jgi:hypothetical protein
MTLKDYFIIAIVGALAILLVLFRQRGTALQQALFDANSSRIRERMKLLRAESRRAEKKKKGAKKRYEGLIKKHRFILDLLNPKRA